MTRLSAGDGFVGGMLYAVLRGWQPDQCLQIGWATGALAATLLTDYAIPADEQQVWSTGKGTPASDADHAVRARATRTGRPSRGWPVAG